MAGLCTGAGLTTDPMGKLAIAGARSVAWPYECAIGTANGIRVDPVTGNAWTSPDVESVVAVAQGPDKNIVPGSGSWPVGSTVIQTLTVEQTVPECGKARWLCWILGGHAGWRAGNNNFWAIERTVTVSVDGVVVGFSGLQQVSVAENTGTGGTISQGSAIESTMLHDLLEPGQTVKVVAVYNLNVYGLTASGVNSLAWRSPKITSTLWRPHP